jgi:hypothetical protein
MPGKDVLLGALRRFVALLAAAAAGSAVLGLLIAGLAGESLLRGIAVGFYLVGIGSCATAFLLGSRPPVRGKDDGGFVGFGRWLGGGVRFATRDEHREAINLPAILVAIGICLIVLGAAVDSRHGLL